VRQGGYQFEKVAIVLGFGGFLMGMQSSSVGYNSVGFGFVAVRTGIAKIFIPRFEILCL
jgi:hypothetical protein